MDRVVDPTRVGPSIWFQVVPEPKTVKNRVHLDVILTDQAGEWAERHAQLAARRDVLLEFGGTIRMELPKDRSAYLGLQMCDPEGNEVCFV